MKNNEKQGVNVLIVDDVIANLIILTEIIKKAGYVARPVTSVRQAMDAITALPPNLILLDITMPEIDGFEYCSMLKKDVRTRDIPVIFISAMTTPESKTRGFSLGAVDFIVKPFDEQEVYLRVNTHIKLYRMQQELEEYNKHLQRMVNEQVRKIADEQKIITFALMRLVARRNSNIKQHMESLGKNARMLSMSLQFSPKFTKLIPNEFVEAIEVAAPLCDIGKSAIPDEIVSKRGPLTPEENLVMERHVFEGYELLTEIFDKNKNNYFVKMAAEIALNHHEKWDGTGYPTGLKGKEIPLSARIVSILDTYIILTGPMNPKGPMPHEMVMDIINRGAGSSFDPDIVDVLSKVQRQLK